MSLAKFNEGGANKFTFKAPQDTPFVTLSELANDAIQAGKNIDDVKIRIRGFFKNTKSKFGPHYVCIATNDDNVPYMVDFPKWLNSTVEEIIADDTAVTSINESEEYFSLYSYESPNKPGETLWGAKFL